RDAVQRSRVPGIRSGTWGASNAPQLGHETTSSGLAIGFPQRHTYPMTRPGDPTTFAKSGTSRVTTLPAPTTAQRPIVTPQMMVALAQMEAPWRTRVLPSIQSA